MHLADEAGVDQRLGDLDLRPAALVEADLQDHARPWRRPRPSSAPLAMSMASGFSQSTCLPRRGRRDHRLGMIERSASRRSPHRHRSPSTSARKLGGMARDAEIARERLGAAGVDVEDRRRASRRAERAIVGACDRRMIAPAPTARCGQVSPEPEPCSPQQFLFSLSASEKAIGALRARGQDWREDRCSGQASGGDALPAPSSPSARRPCDQVAEDGEMLGDHQVDGRRIPVEIEGVMDGDENELAPPDRLAELQVAAAEHDVDMEVLLEPLDASSVRWPACRLLDPLVSSGGDLRARAPPAPGRGRSARAGSASRNDRGAAPAVSGPAYQRWFMSCVTSPVRSSRVSTSCATVRLTP